MDFELLCDTPLFNMDSLGMGFPDVPLDMTIPMLEGWNNEPWELDPPCIPLSNTKLDSLMPSDMNSRKRTFYECEPNESNHYDSGASSGSVSPTADCQQSLDGNQDMFSPSAQSSISMSPSSRAKRIKSDSCEALLQDLPDEGTSIDFPVDWAPSPPSGFSFPPAADPKKVPKLTGLQSVSVENSSVNNPSTKMSTPLSGKSNTVLVQSKEKPNYLKPLSGNERQRLHAAGRGAAIIRVNVDLAF